MVVAIRQSLLLIDLVGCGGKSCDRPNQNLKAGIIKNDFSKTLNLEAFKFQKERASKSR